MNCEDKMTQYDKYYLLTFYLKQGRLLVNYMGGGRGSNNSPPSLPLRDAPDLKLKEESMHICVQIPKHWVGIHMLCIFLQNCSTWLATTIDCTITVYIK